MHTDKGACTDRAGTSISNSIACISSRDDVSTSDPNIGMIFIVVLPIPEVEVTGLGLESTGGSRTTGIHQAILDVQHKPLVVYCGQGPLVEPCKVSICVKCGRK